MKDFLAGTITPKDWAATAAIIAVAVLVSVGFFMLVHKPDMEKLANIQKNDKKLLADIDRATDVKENIDTYRKKMENIERLVTQFEERLPSRREIPRLLKEFEAMAAKEDLDVELSPLSRNLDERKETIPYRIEVVGGFHQIAGFVNRLERFTRYLKISNLEIGSQENGVSTATFTLNTYRFLQSTTDGAT